LGAVIAEKFHLQGFNVIVHCNNSLPQAGQLAGRFNRSRPNSATVLQANLANDREVEVLARQARHSWGSLDVLVNNASAFYPTPLGRVTQSDWDDLLDSNLRGAFFLSQALADSLREASGSIVNLVDIYAEQPRKDYAVYSIAKAGLQAMTRSLAMELAPRVRVNGVAPGAILWPEPANEAEENADAAREQILQSIPLGRVGNPVDIAEAVLFLAVEASYLTGEVLRVDGGRRLNL
jgi:pteridine reductase